MGTFADSLRNGIASSFRTDVIDKLGEDRIKEEIAHQVDWRGFWTIHCDTHIGEVRLNALPNKYHDEMCAWLRGLGFAVEDTYNSYGVRSIKASI